MPGLSVVSGGPGLSGLVRRGAPVMTPQEAAWVREHVWTGAMRKTHRDVPAFFTRCLCQSGPSTWCQMDRHDRCHRATDLPACEAYITNSVEQVAYFGEAYGHPTLSATGWHYERAAMVWLADRVCRWVCPCECGHDGRRAGMPAPRPVYEQDVLFEVVA